MRFNKTLTRAIAALCAFSTGVAPALAAVPVYKVYIPGLTSSSAPRPKPATAQLEFSYSVLEHTAYAGSSSVSVGKTLTLTNLGGAAAPVQLATDSPRYQIASTTCGASLAAHANCTINITFDAPNLSTVSATGTAHLFVNKNTPLEESVQFNSVTLNPLQLSALNPADPVVGSVYPIYFFNQNLSDKGFPLIDPWGAQWTVSGAIPPGMSLYDGQLTGTPTKQGTYSFLLQAAYAGNSVQQTYSLNVRWPGLSVEPQSLVFADTPIDSNATQQVTLRNTGSVAQELSQPDLSNASSTVYLSQDNCSGKILSPNAACTVTVNHHPISQEAVNNSTIKWTGSIKDQGVAATPLETNVSVEVQTSTTHPLQFVADTQLLSGVAGTYYELDLNDMLQHVSTTTAFQAQNLIQANSYTGAAPASTAFIDRTQVSWSAVAVPAGLQLQGNVLTGTTAVAGDFPVTVRATYKGVHAEKTFTLPVRKATLSAKLGTSTLAAFARHGEKATTLTVENSGQLPLFFAKEWTSAVSDLSGLNVSWAACTAKELKPSESCTVPVTYAPTRIESGKLEVKIPFHTAANKAQQNTRNALVQLGQTTALEFPPQVLDLSLTAAAPLSFKNAQAELVIDTTQRYSYDIKNDLLKLAPDLTDASISWAADYLSLNGLVLNPQNMTLSGLADGLHGPIELNVTAATPSGFTASQTYTLKFIKRQLQVSTSNLDFGSTWLTTSKKLSYLIYNVGNTVESVGSATLTGQASEGSVTTNCPSSLAPGASCTVQVEYIPTDEGAWQNTSVQFSSVLVPPVQVMGTATSAISLSIPTQEITVGSPVSIDLKTYFTSLISGTSTWAVDSLPTGLALNAATGVITGTPTAAPPSGTSSHTVTVSYRTSPLLPLQRITATLPFVINDYSWTLSKTQVNFDQGLFEGQSNRGWLNHAQSETLTVVNTGNRALTLASVLDPTAKTVADSFSSVAVDNKCQGTVLPGASCTLVLSYTPTAEHVELALNMVVSSTFQSKTVQLNLTAINPLTLNLAPQAVYTGTEAYVDLDRLLTLGVKNSYALTPANISWTVTGSLPANMAAQAHALTGAVSAPAGTTKSVTVTATYANNTITGQLPLNVLESLVRFDALTPQQVWVGESKTITVPLALPAQNATSVQILAPVFVSATHTALQTVPTHNCGVQAPGTACTLTIQVRTSDLNSIGSQNVVVGLPLAVGSTTQTLPVTVPLSVGNPVALAQPQNLTFLTNHTSSGFKFTSLASYAANPAITGANFTWALQGNLPAGLTFDPQTQVLSGTPTDPATATLDLAATYNGLTVHRTFDVKVIAPSLVADTAAVTATVYHGDTLARTVTMTLPEGGNLTKVPSLTVPGDVGGSSTTCTTGLKTAGYSCQVTLTFNPTYASSTSAVNGTLSWAVPGVTSDIPVAITIANPLSLPDQETWLLVANASPQVLESFGSLLSDKRANNTALPSWSISSTTAAVSVTASGVASASAAVGDGTFTLVVIKGGARLEKPYSYKAVAEPLSVSISGLTAYNGHTTDSLKVAIKNTSGATLGLATTAAYDPNTVDQTTFGTGNGCSGVSLDPAQTCEQLFKVISKDTASSYSAGATVVYEWAPQPMTKPTKTIQISKQVTQANLGLTNPLSLAAPADLVVVQGSSGSLDLTSLASNATGPAAYSWSLANTPTAMSLSAAGVLTYGPATVVGTTNTTVSVSYTTPNGIILTAVKPLVIDVVRLGLSSAAVDFGSVYPNTGTLVQNTVVTNTSSVAVSLGTPVFPAQPTGAVSAVVSACGTLAVGASCTLPVSLVPGVTGALALTGQIPIVYKGTPRATFDLGVAALVLNPLALNTAVPSAYEKTPYSTDLNTLLTHNLDAAPLIGATWSATGLPAGWSLSAGGQLSGTPRDTTPVSFTATAVYKGFTVSALITVTPKPVTIAVAGDLTFGTVYTRNTAVSKTLTVTNTTDTVLTVTPAFASVPEGATITNQCATVSAGASCAVTVAYAPTAVATVSKTLTLNYGVVPNTHQTPVAMTATVLNPLALSSTVNSPVVGLSYSQNFTSNLSSALEPIDSAQVSWTVSSGSFPAGVTFNTATGIASGVATTGESPSFTLTASYKGNSVSRTYIQRTRVWSASSDAATINFGNVYRNVATASKTVVLTNTSIYAGATPSASTAAFYPLAGPIVNPSSSEVSVSGNTCTGSLWAASATCTFTVTYAPTSAAGLATNIVVKLGNSTGTAFTLTIPLTGTSANPLSLDASELSSAATGTAYSTSLTSRLSNAAGSPAGATWTATGLPAGMSLASSTGLISGTATTPGVYTLNVTASLGGNSVTQPMTLRVVSLGLSASPQPLDFGSLYVVWNTATKTLTLTNPTTQSLTPSLTIPAALTSFLSQASTTCTAALAPSASCAYVLTYAPTALTQSLSGQTLPVTVSYTNPVTGQVLTGTQNVSMAATLTELTNPLTIAQPPAQTVVHTVPMTALDLSSYVSFVPDASLPKSALSWTLTGIPTSSGSTLTFDPNSRVLSGTINGTGALPLGTYPLTLTVSYKGQSVTATFNLVVEAMQIVSTPATLAFGSQALGTSATQSVTWTLPKGGELTSSGSTIPASMGSATSTCTPGLKPTGYSCTTAVTVLPTIATPPAMSISLSAPALSTTVPVTVSVTNPLSLAAQEAWTILGSTTQVLEDFSTLLTDSRATDTSPVSWAISSPSATTVAITAAGVATIQLSGSAAATGTFTVTATKNYASVSKTYSYAYKASYFTVNQTLSNPYYGYTATDNYSITPAYPLIMGTSSVTDSNTTDGISYSIGANSCANVTVAASSACTVQIAVKSASTATPLAASISTPVQYAPQPTSKPGRLLNLSIDGNLSGTLTNPLALPAISARVLPINQPHQTDLAPYLTNNAGSATVTWTATGLPAGLSLNTATGLISGTPTVLGSSTVAVTASAVTLNGATLTASQSISFQVMDLKATASTIDFGTFYPGSPAVSKTMTLTNTGAYPLTLGSTTFDTSSAISLTKTGTTCGTSLAAGASCTQTYSITAQSPAAVALISYTPMTYSGTTFQALGTVSGVVLNPMSLAPSLTGAYDKTPFTQDINGQLTHVFKGTAPAGTIWTATSLPAGWALSSTGVLTGTPSSTATLSFAVVATNGTDSVAGTLTLTPNSLTIGHDGPLAFGTVYTNSTAATKTLTVTNTSATALVVTAATSAATTTVASNSCSGGVAAGATCSIVVSYLPTTPAASYTENLTLNYGVYTATHTATTTLSAVPTNPLSLGAGAFYPTLTIPYTYSITGLLASTLETVNQSLVTWTYSGTLPAGVSFNTSTGAFSGTPTVSQATSWTLTAAYKGNTISRTYSLNVRTLRGTVNPTSVNLGTVYANSAATSTKVTFTNTSTYSTGGATSAVIGAPALTVADSRVAIANNTCTNNLTLAYNATCTFDVVVTPTSSTAPVNTAVAIAIKYNGITGATVSAPITAAFNNPLSVSAADLPTAVKGRTYSASLNALLTNANGSVSGASWSVAHLPAGLTYNATTNAIEGTPTVEINSTPTLTASLNGNTAAATVALRVVDLTLAVTPTPIDFGTLYARWASSTKTVTLANNTTRDLGVSAVLPGTTYIVSAGSTCAATLAVGASCTLTYTYAPQTIADKATGQQLTLNTSVLDVTGSTTVPFVDNVQALANPLQMATPATQTILQSHPMSAVTYSSIFSMASGTSVPSGQSVIWSASGLPAGLVFDSNTQTLNGTPTTAGTYSVTLTTTLLDQTRSVTFDIVVLPAVVATSDVAFPAATYPLKASTATVTFTLTNGGNIQTAPAFSIANFTGTNSTSTTCTTGLKAAGYSCTASLTITPTLSVGATPSGTVSLGILGATGTATVSATIANPLSLPTQESWTFIRGAISHTIEDFSTLVSDARGDTSTITWAISSPNLTVAAINTAGVATGQVSTASGVSSGTFTITATKSYGVVASKTYNFTAIAYPLTSSQTNANTYLGYNTNPAVSLTYTNSGTTLPLSLSGLTVTDSNTTDTATFALASNTCTAALAQTQSCALTISAQSTTTSAGTATLSGNLMFPMQPTTKPTRLQAYPLSNSNYIGFSSPLSFSTIPTVNTYQTYSNTFDLKTYLTNAKESAPTYTWSATNLPAGLVINTATGVISGTPTAAVGTYSVPISVTYTTTPLGTAITASTTLSLVVNKLSASMTSMDFGSYYADSTTPPTATTTITNTGSVPITNFAGFALDTNSLATVKRTANTCTSLAVGASCTMSFQLQPSTWGTLAVNLNLSIQHNAFTGAAFAPTSAVLATTLTLNPTMPVAYDKTPYSVNINGSASHYSAPSPLSNVTWTSNGYPAGWAISAAGTVTGTPTAAGTLSLPTAATYNGITGYATYSLTVNPVTVSTSGSLAYGSVYTNGPAVTKTIQITNTTGTTLAVVTPSITTPVSTLSLVNNTCAAGLAPNASCSVDVSYAPTTPAASYSNSLTVAYGVTSATHSTTVALSATPTNPLAITYSTPNPVVGLSYTLDFKSGITNALEPAWTATDRSAISWTWTGALPAGITFDTATGVFSGRATASESVAGTVTASYKGNTVSKSYTVRTRVYAGTAAPASISYGTVYTKQTPITQHIVVTNGAYYDTTKAGTTMVIHPTAPNPFLSPTNSEFAISNSTCIPGNTMAIASTCEFDLTYTPTVAAAVSSAVKINFGNGSGIPFVLTIPLSATTLNPLALADTVLPVGFKSQAYTAVDFTTLLSSANSSISGATWSATGVPAGMSLNATTGVLSGTPTVEMAGSITVTASLAGNSVSRTYALSVYSLDSTLTPASLAFGSVATNWESPAQTVTYSNTSTRVQTLALTIPSAISSFVTKDSSSTCGATLAAGASCTFVIKYAPTSTAQTIGTQSLTITTTSDNSMYTKASTISVTGTAYNPLSLSPTISDPVFVGFPFSYDLQGRNLLPLATDKTGTSWTGSSASINSVGTLSLAAPTTTAAITVSATATLRGNVATQTYTLTPINTTFTATPSSSALALGTVYTNTTPVTRTITLTNNGAYSFDINGTPTFSLTNAAQNFTVTANTCTSLAPGASCSLTISYAPTVAATGVSTVLSMPVYKYGKLASTATVTITADAVNPLQSTGATEWPVAGVPFTWDFRSNFSSAIEQIDFSQATFSMSGSLPPGLTFSNGVVSGTPSADTLPTTTVTLSYKGNTLSGNYVFPVRTLLTSMDPADSSNPYRYYNFGNVPKYSGPYSVTQTMRNISTYSAPLKIMGPLWTSSTLSDYGLSITANTCTTGRVLAANETCSYTMTFNPTVNGNWSGIPYFEVWTGVPFGYNSTTVNAHPVTYTGSAYNPVYFDAVPNMTLNVGFPYSGTFQAYSHAMGNPGAYMGYPYAFWFYGGSFPSGIGFDPNTGNWGGTPTTVQSTSVQVSVCASIYGVPTSAANPATCSANSTNVFNYNVVDPIAYVPPTNSSYLYGSSFNPTSLGNVFVEQTVTVPVTWTFNSAVQLTTSPYLVSGFPGLYVSWTNCPGPGSTVSAGSSCQANVTLTGNAAGMGSFMSAVALGVGANGTTYRTNSVYVAGNVLNPLESYAQEDIWAIAANTWVMPYANGWIYNDRYPTSTPVSVSIAPLAGYNPVYLNSGWLVRDGNETVSGTYPVRMTITKQTNPPISITRDFNVIARPSHAGFPTWVVEHYPVWAGYKNGTVRYRLRNDYGTTITPFIDSNNWQEIDFYPWDGASATRDTDCARTLTPGATCDYVRAINPGAENPGKDAYFGVNRAFNYNPQPNTRSWHYASASLPVRGGAVAGAPGAVPNHTLEGLFSGVAFGEPFVVVYQDAYWSSSTNEITTGFLNNLCAPTVGTQENWYGQEPCNYAIQVWGTHGGDMANWNYSPRPFYVVNQSQGNAFVSAGSGNYLTRTGPWPINMYVSADGYIRGRHSYGSFDPYWLSLGAGYFYGDQWNRWYYMANNVPIYYVWDYVTPTGRRVILKARFNISPFPNPGTESG